MLNTVYINNRAVTKEEIESMSIKQLNEFMCELQETISSIVIEKNRLTTLPKSKKDGTTITKVRKLCEKLSIYQNTVNFVSLARKNRRDVQVAENDWYRSFYKFAQTELRKGLFEKIESLATIEVGYPRP